MLFSGRIDRCYDSHVHWLATGEYASRLPLSQMTSRDAICSLRLEPHYFQGQWLIGFGWDQTKWVEAGGGTADFPSRGDLDRLLPDRPAVLSRADGHVYWVNTKALQLAGLLDDRARLVRPLPETKGGKIIVDANGIPTGIFVDTARELIDPFVPKPSPLEVRNFLLRAARIFNRAGFTHIRDLSCSPTQWTEALHLAESGLLPLFVDQFISANSADEFDAALELALLARKQQHPRLQVRGLKVYIDGALGSEGAWISRPYASGSGMGLCLLERKQLVEQMKTAFSNGFEFAVHAIGDKAAEMAMDGATEVWNSGLAGRLHLEHCELLDPKTLETMRGQTVTCHLQPCHWLTDRHWLKVKLGELARLAFPWRALEDAEVPFFFGSDTPIEPPSLLRNLEALKESENSGLPHLRGSPLARHSHPDPVFGANTYTVFDAGRPVQVVCDGVHLY